MLRLLYDLRLMGQLQAALAGGSLNRLKAVNFFRVMDNQPVRLAAADFWVHLNYQVTRAQCLYNF